MKQVYNARYRYKQSLKDSRTKLQQLMVMLERDNSNIPREYYLKINNKRNNYINSHLDKNPNAGKINFMSARAKTYNIISQMLQVPIIRVYNKT